MTAFEAIISLGLVVGSLILNIVIGYSTMHATRPILASNYLGSLSAKEALGSGVSYPSIQQTTSSFKR